MKLALGLLLFSRVAFADPIEVDLETIDNMHDDLPWADTEPGGMLVGEGAHKDYYAIGLRNGDLVQRVNGAPVSTSWRFSEGVMLVDVLRAGKPLQLRVILHGDALRTVHLTDSDIQDLLDDKKPPSPTVHAVTIKRGKVVTGVRIISDVRKLELVAGDLVRRIGRALVQDDNALTELVAGLPAGHHDMIVERDGREITITLEREPSHHR